MMRYRRLMGILLLVVWAPLKAFSLDSERVAFEDIASWPEDNHAELLALFHKACPHIQHAHLQKPCRILDNHGYFQRQPRQFFELYFQPYRVTQQTSIAGYHEIVLHGSRAETSVFRYPLYRRPPAGTPRYTRREIERGALEAQSLPPLAYVDDPVQLWLLHHHGYGVIMFGDGTSLALEKDGDNGLPTRDIRLDMVKQGLIGSSSLTILDMKTWLYAHPEQASRIMEYSPAYSFFKERHGDVTGALGLPLVAERSMAVDGRSIPLGTPLWVSTTLPATPVTEARAYQRMMIAHDAMPPSTGGHSAAIYWGRGDRAEEMVENGNQPATLYVLWPK